MSGDSRFFSRGKVHELKAELVSDKKDKQFMRRKTALKRVIANMTMSNDMSPLFPEVISSMAVPDLEVKKMSFLFLVNYARSHPEMAQNALPILIKDLDDTNPLIRALSLRTLSYIHVKEVITALIEPVGDMLRDPDPYVRKTAALAIAKIHGHDKIMLERTALITELRELLTDTNPTVVATVLSALMDIADRSDVISINLNFAIASKLVSILSECSEWSQVYILESLMNYVPQETADAELLADKVAPRLQGTNSSVVLAAMKVIMYLINYMSTAEDIEASYKKLSAPLVTLASSKSPEIQLVILRNAELLIKRRPDILRKDLKVFFCRYNDPIYVKLSKLELIVSLADAGNTDVVLAELKEYATEIDIDFVRKAVRSIGRLALKIDSAATNCVRVLVDLMSNNVDYAVQEAVVVMRDIFRKYPNRYEGVIPTLCKNFEYMEEPESKTAIIWIVGHYSRRIEQADVFLQMWLSHFWDEPIQVQLALLTATVKHFMAQPTKGGDLVTKVLKLATEEADDPDLRDRGFMYWRLLSVDPKSAKQIVSSEMPPIEIDTGDLDAGYLQELYLNMSSLASVYQKLPRQFIRGARTKRLQDSPALQSNMHEKPLSPELTKSA